MYYLSNNINEKVDGDFISCLEIDFNRYIYRIGKEILNGRTKVNRNIK